MALFFGNGTPHTSLEKDVGVVESPPLHDFWDIFFGLVADQGRDSLGLVLVNDPR